MHVRYLLFAHDVRRTELIIHPWHTTTRPAYYMPYTLSLCCDLPKELLRTGQFVIKPALGKTFA